LNDIWWTSGAFDDIFCRHLLKYLRSAACLDKSADKCPVQEHAVDMFKVCLMRRLQFRCDWCLLICHLVIFVEQCSSFYVEEERLNLNLLIFVFDLKDQDQVEFVFFCGIGSDNKY
jgi:hypothetical protein